VQKCFDCGITSLLGLPKTEVLQVSFFLQTVLRLPESLIHVSGRLFRTRQTSLARARLAPICSEGHGKDCIASRHLICKS